MNYIIIKNIREHDIEEAASALAESYFDSGFVNSIIINRVEMNHYMVEFPGHPDFERFMYFVNYLTYPETELKDKPVVYGIWNEDKPNQSIHSRPGEKLLVYVSPSDTEHDNVSILNAGGKTYKYSFSGKVSEVANQELNYHELTILPAQYTELIEIVPSKAASEHEVKPWWKFW